MILYGEYFCGNRVSQYGREHGYLDYATLAKAFDCVLNNDIMDATLGLGYWEQQSGFNEFDEPEVFQWYIVSEEGAKILREIDEITYYSEPLNVHLWGVTHYGTAWDYVLTDVPINQPMEEGPSGKT